MRRVGNRMMSPLRSEPGCRRPKDWAVLEDSNGLLRVEGQMMQGQARWLLDWAGTSTAAKMLEREASGRAKEDL